MLTIATVRSGDKYGQDYEDNFFNMINRHVTVPHQLMIIKGSNGWWDKLRLFSGYKDRILFFDLDVIILDNIDDIVSYEGNLMMMENFKWGSGAQDDKYSSAIMSIPPVLGDYHPLRGIWDKFTKDPEGAKASVGHKGDQRFIETWLDQHGQRPTILQELFSGVYSYKKHCMENPHLSREQKIKLGIKPKDIGQNKPPDDARIICFHGEPKNHQLMHLDWVKENWR